jgi:hypothetical protein
MELGSRTMNTVSHKFRNFSSKSILRRYGVVGDASVAKIRSAIGSLCREFARRKTTNIISSPRPGTLNLDTLSSRTFVGGPRKLGRPVISPFWEGARRSRLGGNHLTTCLGRGGVNCRVTSIYLDPVTRTEIRPLRFYDRGQLSDEHSAKGFTKWPIRSVSSVVT